MRNGHIPAAGCGRVPWDVMAVLLRQEAVEKNKPHLLRVTNDQARQWVHRGYLSRGTGGYDPVELVLFLDRWYGRAA